jgi:hypothetical protein
MLMEINMFVITSLKFTRKENKVFSTDQSTVFLFLCGGGSAGEAAGSVRLWRHSHRRVLDPNRCPLRR